MGEKRDEFVGSALAESGRDRRDADEKLFKVRKRSRLSRREGGEKRQEANAVENVESILCAEGECALAVLVGVLVEERELIRACAGGSSAGGSLEG